MKENKILGFFTNDGEYYDFGNELTEEAKEIFIEFVRKLTKNDDNKNIKEIVYKK